MAIHVINEAKRCLNCKKPMCREGCPIHTPIPDMIHTFLEGDINQAGEMVFENNPLSIVCSLICNHENQCEGHCVLNRKGSPVHISSIENYISENYFDKLGFSGIEKNGLKAGIIGSGPAGITIAVILAQRGYDITIFESREKIGGVLRYGIPEFRLPKSILERYKEKLIELGIKIRPNTAIGTTISVDDMFRDGYSAIFIGTGVWKPNTLHIKGETLGNVHYAINYLTNPDVYRLGDTVNIIGAGNSAMDVARTALRHGAKKVTVFSRSDHLAASQREVDYAKIDGVEFVVHVEPVEIVDDGVIFVELECDDTEDLMTNGFIPFLTISNEEVIRAYIKFLDNKKVSAVLEKLSGNEYIDTFWKYFNAYSSISEGFDEFENKFVLEKAEEWCKSNSIEYSVEK